MKPIVEANVVERG